MNQQHTCFLSEARYASKQHYPQVNSWVDYDVAVGSLVKKGCNLMAGHI
jgi:hypothetical protein